MRLAAKANHDMLPDSNSFLKCFILWNLQRNTNRLALTQPHEFTWLRPASVCACSVFLMRVGRDFRNRNGSVKVASSVSLTLETGRLWCGFHSTTTKYAKCPGDVIVFCAPKLCNIGKPRFSLDFNTRHGCCKGNNRVPRFPLVRRHFFLKIQSCQFEGWRSPRRSSIVFRLN